MSHVVVISYYSKKDDVINTMLYNNPNTAWEVVGQLMLKICDSDRYINDFSKCRIQGFWQLDLKEKLENKDFEAALSVFNSNAKYDTLSVELKKIN